MKSNTQNNSLKINRKQLDNGLDVVVLVNPTAPVVCINLGYKVGSKDEPSNRTGMAHLCEHLMFEGTTNLPKGGFDRLCSAAGGSNNAYTTFDWTSYTMTLPSNQLELGFWLESDRMFNFTIDAGLLENQRKVVVEEIRQTIDNQPYGRWREKLGSAAFLPRSPYSWEVHGRKEHVAHCKLEDIEKFHSRFYTPANACLVVCGNVEPDHTIELAHTYFSGNSSGSISIKSGKNAIKKKPSLKIKQIGARNVSLTDSVPLEAVFVAYHCPGFKNRDTNIAEIAAYIAGNGRSSRLYSSLVHESQIASSVGAFLDKRELASLLIFYAIAAQPDITCSQLYEALAMEINQLKYKGISEKELYKSRNQLSTQLAFEMQYSSGLADIAVQQTLFWSEPERIFTLLDDYLLIQKPQVDEFLRMCLAENNMVRVDVVPVKSFGMK